MHIPLIGPLAARLLPLLHPSPPPGSSDVSSPSSSSLSSPSLSFRPIHAHAHSSHAGIMMHDAAGSTPLYTASAADALDADEEAELAAMAAIPLNLRTRKITIRRPRVRPPSMISWALSAARHPSDGIILPFSSTNSRGGYNHNTTETWTAPDLSDAQGDWDDVEVDAPDVTDRQTILTLAKMTSNAYTLPTADDWYPLGKFNRTTPFGWEDDADGLRGHIFADEKNATVVISIKGTSAGVLGSGGPTAKNDKYNDNLLFSCCCARVDFSWTPVCDCYAGGYRCEQKCLEKALVEESVYATVGTNLYNNITYMYPDANIWLVGHSLGGSVSALIGLAFGAPVVAFEAPGERLAARRLHLPLPPGMPSTKTGITHVYHTADPIPMGACTGAYSGCYAAGFALESRCHTGETILYDTVTVKGWSVDVRTHRIGEVISKVLMDPWPVEDGDDGGGDKKKGAEENEEEEKEGEEGGGVWADWWGWKRRGPRPGDRDDDGGNGGDGDDDGDTWDKHGGVPVGKTEDDCVDCYKWEFGDGWDKKGKDKDGDKDKEKEKE